MANKISNLAKTLKKNSNGYNYKYTDLAGIHEALAGAGISYWQEVTQVNDKDYIKTHVIDDETGEEIRSGLGAEIVEATEINGKLNPAQAQGASISYSRRYSLLLILGLATEDDDAESLTQSQPAQHQSSKRGVSFDEIREKIKDMERQELEQYKAKVLSANMTDRQAAAIKAIFKQREDAIVAHNMGY